MQTKKIANLPEQINIKNIQSSLLMHNGKKRYSMLSCGTTREQIVFQTPLFQSAMDVEKFNDYADYYYIIPDNAEGKMMLQFILDLEQHIIQILFKNKENWFPNIDNVTFRSLIKNYTNDDNVEYKVIKFKIPYDTKTNLVNVDTMENLDLSTGNREKISVKDLGDGLVRMIVNVNAIWLTDNMFGIYLRPINIEEVRLPSEPVFEFQNTNVNNETISKTIYSITQYIESEIKENNINVIEENNNEKHIGRVLKGKGKGKEKNKSELSLHLSDTNYNSDTDSNSESNLNSESDTENNK